jgi:hypothetical protein
VVVSRIGLFSELTLEEPARGARLWFEHQGRQFVTYDHAGPRGGVLHLLHLCLLRVPYELPPGLAWDDLVLRRQLRPRWWRAAVDAVEPFLPMRAVRLALRAERVAAGLEVMGEGRLGARPVRTRALLDARGPAELALEVGGERFSARLLEVTRDA